MLFSDLVNKIIIIIFIIIIIIIVCHFISVVKTIYGKILYFVFFLLIISGVRCISVVRAWLVLSCLWDNAYKRTLAANRKEKHMWWQQVSSLAIWVVLYHMSDTI